MKKILAVYPYTILPPLGGGALRCLNLLKQLAAENEVYAIVHQRRSEWDRCRAEYAIPDSVVFYSSVDEIPPPSVFEKLPERIGPGLKYRWIRRSWRGPAESALLRSYHLIEKLLQAMPFDFVLFEHLSTMAAASLVRRVSPHTKRILDAHNVDHLLLAQELRNSPGDRTRQSSLRKALWQEQNLSRFVDFFFACSDFDRDTLARESGVPGFTVPNGVDCDYFEFDPDPEKSSGRKLIFTGWLGTMANQDALSFIADEIWPEIQEQLPGLELDIVGGGIPDVLRNRMSSIPALNLVGEVPDMRPYYRQSAILLVPLRVGSGTRLKILEAMSQGNPVISTHKGAEGLSMQPGEHLLKAETAREFAGSVKGLLEDPAFFERLRYRARERVEKHFDWKVIGQSASRLLQDHAG
jgi:glycosyltransferase involved in cell wall biosynthesis